MTNEEIEKYCFKHYSLELSLMKATSLLRNLLRDLHDQMGTIGANYEMKSEAQAELRGITQWCSYNPQEYCNQAKHYSRSVFIKTSLGWMHHCCAKDLGLTRLPDTYIEPNIDEIKNSFDDRKHELELIIQYKKRQATLKGIATKKAQSEKLALEKELRKITRALAEGSKTPKEKLDKEKARAQKKIENVFKESLLALN